ncbi:hypothetical protein SESBI_47344 [Sesbania bispinosa]|nr:hypothetical protein SESBI_47344 [Sesbania bispinosa]
MGGKTKSWVKSNGQTFFHRVGHVCLVDGVSDTLTKEYMHFHAIVAKLIHVHYTASSSALDKTKPRMVL